MCQPRRSTEITASRVRVPSPPAFVTRDANVADHSTAPAGAVPLRGTGDPPNARRLCPPRLRAMVRGEVMVEQPAPAEGRDYNLAAPHRFSLPPCQHDRRQTRRGDGLKDRVDDDSLFAGWTDRDQVNGGAEELFHAADVRLGFLRQVIEVAHLCSRSEPTG